MTGRTFFITGILALGLMAATSMAFAGPGWGRGGFGPCAGSGFSQGAALTPDQQATYDKLVADFNAKTETARNELWASRLELNALSGNSQAEPSRITELIKTIQTRQNDLTQAQNEFNAKVQKEVGVNPATMYGAGRGYGRGNMMGNGYGRGYMMGNGGAGGYGPGNCPNW